MFKKILSIAAMAFALGTAPALAQTCPAPAFYYGQVLTAAQWNQQFYCKQALLGYVPVNKAGDTMLGKLNLAPSTTLNAGLNLGLGFAPTAPLNGDAWLTAAGLSFQLNGLTIGPHNTPTYTGAAAPSVPTTYSFWNNTSGATVPYSIYDGAQWVNIGTLDPATHTWSAAAGGSVTSFSAGSTGFTPSSATTGAITMAGTLNAAHGGTGITSLGTGIPAWLGTPSSANLITALTDETGGGLAVFNNAPAITAPTIAGGTATALTGLAVRNAGTGAFDMTIAHNGTLTAGRALTFNLNDAARTVSLGGNLTLGGALATSGAFGSTFTMTNTTAVTFPTSGTLLSTAAAVTVAQGGTGVGTFTAHGVLLGEGTGNIVPTAAMTDGQLLVGQTGADPLPKTLTGDVTITAAGVTAIGTNKVTNAQRAQMATNTIKGNNTGGTANETDLSVAQVQAMLGVGQQNIPYWHLYRSSTQGVSAGSSQLIQWNATRYDSATSCNTSSTFLCTPLTAGLYSVTCAARISNTTGPVGAGNASVADVQIKKNGTVVAEQYDTAQVGALAGAVGFALVTTVVLMNGTTDTLGCYTQNDGTAPVVYGDASGSVSFFAAYRTGPQ